MAPFWIRKGFENPLEYAFIGLLYELSNPGLLPIVEASVNH